MVSMSVWGTIEPAESTYVRLRLDFGLRPAILALNEWAVPGLGGAFFVRQLTWACLGITLAEEMPGSSAAQIAEGLEALASWIALRQGDYDKDDRIQGKRKLRNLDGLSFNAVSKGGAYVTVPFRRAATAALPGLGLCTSAQFRFNSLQLAPTGAELANAVLADDGVARKLRNWIAEPATPIKSSTKQLKQALLPRHETAEECRLVRDSLLADPARARIVRLLQPLEMPLPSLQTTSGIATFLGRIDDPVQAARLDVCFAFERVRVSALQAAQTMVDAVQATAQPWPALAKSDEVQRGFAALERDCGMLSDRLDKLPEVPPGLRQFCEEQRPALGLEPRMRALATRLPQVLLVQPQALARGMDTSKNLLAADVDDSLDSEAASSALVPRPLLRLKRLHQEALAGITS